MSQVDQVALWAGLISSIVGIVLSIVAIVSSVLTGIRQQKVTDQTIKSLQKIESDVQRISEETNGLIKAGWERMLGMTAGASPLLTAPLTTTAASAKEIAEGLVSEIRSAIQDAKDPSLGNMPDTETLLREIRNTIAAQMGAVPASRPRNSAPAIDRRVALLPELARELAYRIRRSHLTVSQYQRLRADDHLGNAVSRLRRLGILVPLRGDKEDGEGKEQVYWFPPDSADSIKTSLLLSRPDDSEVRDIVDAHLKAIAYTQDD